MNSTDDPKNVVLHGMDAISKGIQITDASSGEPASDGILGKMHEMVTGQYTPSAHGTEDSARKA